MKILVSWLKEYVDVPVPIDQLAKDLTMRGFEVASVEPVNGDPDDAVIDFEVTANRPDCLSVLGMAREVAVKYGLALRSPVSAFSIGSSAFDARVPGTRNPAPAFAAGFGAASPDAIRVTVERPDLCPLYCAALVDVSIGPSPAWLAERLTLSGVRSINNIVDVTNYVLLELNQPLHAFDFDTIGDRHLVVRTARAGETLTTLDGVTRTLADDMLVIADAGTAQAVAGVMGGGATEIGPTTRTIALESAYFEPTQVRRTRRRLNLSTEASYRFERGVDPGMPARALRRAVELIVEIGAGTPRDGEVIVGTPSSTARSVRLRWSRIWRVLGMDVAPAEVEQILTLLGFHFRPIEDGGLRRKASSDGRTGSPLGAEALAEAASPAHDHPSPEWNVTVPGWRGDVTREEDLIEEIARCAGYERLPVTFPALAAPPAKTAPRLVRDARVRDVLVGAGFAEAVTFTFIERAAAVPFDAAPIAIANPLSELFAVLRPSVVPGVVDSLSHNRRREQHDIRLFEVGTRFTRTHGETRSVAIAWTGAAAAEHWSGSGRMVDLYDVLGVLQRVAETLRVRVDVEADDHPALLTGRAARLVAMHGNTRVDVGWVGQLSPSLGEARGLPAADAVLVAELDLDLAAPDYDPDRQPVMQALPRHPSVVRDLSIVLPADLPAVRVRGTIHASAPPTLVSVREFDRYQGKSLPDGKVSLSLRLTFRAAERTLTDAEVQHATDAILAALAADHGATLR
ncbi:Phenylalanine--tRNA ligase beta subunit [Luteitalea pratensis]|uniref:Phenylalanine--tRNA ligase beta subunit n=1 Tax=Luteitalea pratensis TaxID=1855912 RepID=A0A143PNA8_LUTPR|nr:phenylalanine--tRNA ligase subunit beta [Luteitalea pratensis]AMY09630.1 Phenylalanine--tRNA ligase beta subunit [Luteitalea pratensis]